MFLDSLEQDRFRLSGTNENIDKEKVIDNTEKTYSRQEEQMMMMMMVALPNIDKNDKEIKIVKNSKKTQNQEKEYKKILSGILGNQYILVIIIQQ